ncbi:MAG: alpha/beta fold hydrolase [Marmoricola sp.]
MAYDLVRTGSGPKLLLLHSGFHTWVEFRRLIDLLADGHEVLATTQPGSVGGPPLDPRRSMLDQHATYVAGVLDEAGWDDGVTAVGSSFGGVLALELLARERISRAVALAPPWVAGAGLAFYAALFSSVLPAVRLTRPLWPYSTRSATITSLWFHQSRRPTAVDAADVSVLLDSVARFPFFRTGLVARSGGPGMPDLAKVDSTRVTLAWGSRDFLVPTWMRDRWSAALPDADVVRLPGFAHQPHLQDPATVASLIADHA